MNIPSYKHMIDFIKFHWNSIFSVLFRLMKNGNYVLFINCFLHKGKPLSIEWPKLPPLKITALHTCIYFQKTQAGNQGRFLCILPSSELSTKLTCPESPSDALELSATEKTGQLWVKARKERAWLSNAERCWKYLNKRKLQILFSVLCGKVNVLQISDFM